MIDHRRNSGFDTTHFEEVIAIIQPIAILSSLRTRLKNDRDNEMSRLVISNVSNSVVDSATPVL